MENYNLTMREVVLNILETLSIFGDTSRIGLECISEDSIYYYVKSHKMSLLATVFINRGEVYSI